jgi:WD40 repeat protein
VSDGSLVATFEMPAVHAVAFSPSGDRFAAAHFDGELRLWSLKRE